MKLLAVLAELVIRVFDVWAQSRKTERREEVRRDPVGEFNDKFGGLQDNRRLPGGSPKDPSSAD
ncbi:hypothetical protein KUW19_00785 [Ferrimonas balearica]|uniref:hypothetical protein n=1 Tax=Ferrimonas balearica TaxID=44012 RepID=UPI001C980D6E|nr:hypothetical protein [Ferrimonas balearica]MBY6105012.1 hypothetical protein [Ferrimonas balearica]